MSSILKVSEIQDPTNGNSALSIDTSGRVLPGTPVYANLHHNQSSASVGQVGTFVELPIDTMRRQSGGFSLSSNRVTVPLTGVYRWTAAIQINFTSSRRAMSLALYKNGTIDGENTFSHYCFAHVSATTHGQMIASGLFDANANDAMSLYLREYDNNVATVKVNGFTMDFVG